MDLVLRKFNSSISLNVFLVEMFYDKRWKQESVQSVTQIRITLMYSSKFLSIAFSYSDAYIEVELLDFVELSQC